MMEDFDLSLLKGVHDRGMKLILDLVVNHTSDDNILGL
ncbi:alpha-amylase family glycosyl hydrolase [Staphylococcus aureus]